MDEVGLIRPIGLKDGSFAAGYTLAKNLLSVNDVSPQMLISGHGMMAFSVIQSAGVQEYSSKHKIMD